MTEFSMCSVAATSARNFVYCGSYMIFRSFDCSKAFKSPDEFGRGTVGSRLLPGERAVEAAAKLPYELLYSADCIIADGAFSNRQFDGNVPGIGAAAAAADDDAAAWYDVEGA